MTSLEVSGAMDGEIFKRDKMGRVRVTPARREALLKNLNAAGRAERSLPNMWDQIFDLRQLDPKAAAAPKVRGWNCRSEPRDRNQEDGPDPMVGNDVRWGRT